MMTVASPKPRAPASSWFETASSTLRRRRTALESITVDVIEALAASMKIPFVRRSIDRTELLIADEIAICGTLAELPMALSIEGMPLPDTRPLLSSLQARYLAAVKGVDPHPAVQLSVIEAAVGIQQ
jgi:branched-chain amino acid aminotransferase